MSSLDGVTVKIDNSKEYEIKVSLSNGNTLVFRECNDGLYHLNIANINKEVMDFSCLQTVKKHISHSEKLR